MVALNYPGSSGVVLYSTGRAPPPPANDTPSVPEPASWLIMIGGFGLVGYTLRRRRQALSFG